MLATVVQGACEPEDANAPELATLSLRLAETLRMQLDRRQEGRDKSDKDPAFARRAAVNQLSQALTTFKQHGRVELLEALLTLASFSEPALHRVLHNPNDEAHAQLVRLLEESRSAGVNELLAGVLKDLAAPMTLMRIAAGRRDEESVGHIMRYLGYPIGARAIENALRLEEIAWVDAEHREVLLKLDGPGQAAAIQLAAASSIKPRSLAQLILMLLDGGREEGRLEACRAIARLPTNLAREPIEVALQDESSPVAATATKLLRKKNLPDALGQLVGLLDHGEGDVRGAAQEELPEVSYSGYRDGYRDMSDRQREDVGLLVAKGDQTAAESLAAELSAGPPERRLLALDMIDQMGMISELSAEIVRRVRDSDTGVRAEAVRLLGRAPESNDVIRALRDALRDPSPAVVAAAQESLAEFDFWNEEIGK